MNDWRNKWFPWIVAVLPAFFPLYLVRGSWFGFPVTLFEVLVGAVFLMFIFTEGVWHPRWWRRLGSEWKLGAVALFLVAAFLSTVFVQQGVFFQDGTPFEAGHRAIGILKGWIVMPVLYFVMARSVFLERPSFIRVSLDALLLGAAVLACMALQQELSGHFLTPDGRASGPFESANYLSLYLGPVLVYGVLQTLTESGWDLRRSFRLLLTVLVAAGFYFTESYAAWLAVLAALGLWVLFQLKSLPKRWRIGLITGVLVAGAVLLISQLGSEKFTQFWEWNERSSTSVRLQVYEISLNLIQTHPVLGLGLGAFEWFYQDQAVAILGKTPYEWVMIHPHNIFLAMWLNMGLLGLIAFVWMCVRALAWLFEKDKKGRRVAAFMLVGLLVHGLFDTPYFKNDLAFEFWLLMAILL